MATIPTIKRVLKRSHEMSKYEEVKESESTELIDITTFLADYFRIFRRMWKRILLLALVGAVFCYFRGNAAYQPQYTASATFTINIRQEQQDGTVGNASFFDNSTAEQMAKTFPYILTSGVLQRKVAAEMNQGAMSGRLSAEVMKDTNLLTISVTDIDAERAYQTLQAVLHNYPEVSEVIVGKVNMESLDETGIPPLPDNVKNLKPKAVKGGIAGALLGMLWAGVVMISRKTIRREEDCPKLVNQKCLGSVPRVRFKERSKKIEHHLNITEEMTDQEFAETFRIIRNKVQRSVRENNLKSIIITSTLAGEGKSTIAVNLALSLAQEGKRVALVDCDLRHPSDSAILNMEEGEGLSEYLQDKNTFEKCLLNEKQLGLEDSMKMVYVQGGTAVADGSELLGSKKMQDVIKLLEKKMDFVIVDSAPIGLLTDAGVLAQFVDGAIYVIKKDFAHADHILEGMEHLAEMNVHMIGCVLNGDY